MSTSDLPNNVIPFPLSRKKPSFGLFIQQVKADQLTGAAHTLSRLFDLDLELCHQSAVFFQQKLRDDRRLAKKVRAIEAELLAGRVNSALLFLNDCFDIQGPLALTIIGAVKKRHKAL